MKEIEIEFKITVNTAQEAMIGAMYDDVSKPEDERLINVLKFIIQLHKKISERNK